MNLFQHFCRLSHGTHFLFVLGTILLGAPSPLRAQQIPNELVNGDLEQTDGDSNLIGWKLISPDGGRLVIESESAQQGQQAACLDSRDCPDGSGQLFTNLMQVIDASKFSGQRIRLRAQVRTADLQGTAGAQLWMRVDLPAAGEVPQTGAFDNMQDRPIRRDAWSAQEIVLDVDRQATQIALGIFLLGRGRAWLDSVTLDVVSADTPVTGSTINAANDRDGESGARTPSRFSIDPRVMRALGRADQAPTQPFWTPWLSLAAVAILLMALSGWPPYGRSIPALETGATSTPLRPRLGGLPKFAFRFTFAYWILYSFPAPFSQLLPGIGSSWQLTYRMWVDRAVEWAALSVFHWETELVPPNGSGDTTYNYIQVGLVFCLALGVALLWTLLDRRATDYRILKDLLRSYLRYVLGLTLLGYGLAKVAWSMNQFPTLAEMGELQLNKTWGDSSPMNVLWAFMGASRPFTVFAGLGEVLGGVLLAFRRTATLGALISAGVLLNVVLMNFCYDVPVKLYSSHLFLMALTILLPNASQLANLLLWHRPAMPLDLRPPYTNATTLWGQRAIKLAIVTIGFAWPIGQHVQSQFQHFAEQAKQHPFIGEFRLESGRMNGAELPPALQKWNRLRFVIRRDNRSSQDLASYGFVLQSTEGERLESNLSVSDSSERPGSDDPSARNAHYLLSFGSHSVELMPQASGRIEPLSDGRWKLTGQAADGDVELIWVPIKPQALVLSRGFRWINEVPFNR